MVFLQNLIETAGFADVFPPNFPYATHQALALPLAEPGMSRADIMRHVYKLAAVGAEVTRIAHSMNLQHIKMLKLLGGEREVILIMEVEPRISTSRGTLTASRSVVVHQSP